MEIRFYVDKNLSKKRIQILSKTNMRLGSFIKMARPANIITAISDIVAGLAISGVLINSFDEELLRNSFLLILATIGLYGGGIVFNDIFDIEDDKKNRPERVLPSGKISKQEAIYFGSLLFLTGISCGFLVSVFSGMLATTTAALAMSYDKFSKHNTVLGPINMGLCRSANLLLGMSIVPSVVSSMWFIGFVPLVFVAAITLVGQKEAHGHNKNSIFKAILLDTSVVGFFIVLMLKGYLDILTSSPFLIFWYGINLNAKIRAIKNNIPEKIKNAVKTGVLSLIPLNAIYVAGFSNGVYGLLLLCLLPLSIFVAKRYAVT